VPLTLFRTLALSADDDSVHRPADRSATTAVLHWLLLPIGSAGGWRAPSGQRGGAPSTARAVLGAAWLRIHKSPLRFRADISQRQAHF